MAALINDRINTSKLLEKLLTLGFAWLLLGLFLLPTRKLYHQGMILFFWLPGVLVLLKDFHLSRFFDRRLMALFLVAAAWAGLSIVWGGSVRQLKEIGYLILTVNAVAMLAYLNNRLLWKTLAWVAFGGGFLAWASIFYCYFILGNEWAFRAIGIGVLEHTILATHVMGVLCLLLVNLRRLLPKMIRKWYWVIPCFGYLAFLLLSRTKGTLLAMIVCLVLSYIWKPVKRSLMLAAATLAFSTLALIMFPHELLRDGFSYRPELLVQGFQQWMQHPLLGIGVDTNYLLTLPASGLSYEHAHNFFMHMSIQLGVIGLFLWLALLAMVSLRGWQQRRTLHGRALCAVLCFGGIALMTDGTGPWVKPREEWFTIWLPIFLAFALPASWPQPKPHDCCHQP